MANPVYVSFAPADREAASGLAAYLEQASFPCTLSSPAGPASEGVMAVYFTEAAKSSPEVLHDFEVAVSRGIHVIGLRITSGFLPESIEKLNPRVEWVIAIVGRPEDQYDKLAARLAGVLRTTAVRVDNPRSSSEELFVGGTSDTSFSPRDRVFDEEVHSAPDSLPPVITEPAEFEIGRGPDEVILESGAPYGVVLVNPGHDKIEVIKSIRQLTGLGLKESSDLVANVPACLLLTETRASADELVTLFRRLGADVHVEENWNDEDAQRDLIAPPVTPDLPSGDGNRFDVQITSPGNQKLMLIKIVRDCTGLGLSESKDIVDGPMPVTIARVGEMEANQLRDSLYAAGASAVVLRESSATAPHFIRRPVQSGSGCQTSVIGGFMFIVAFVAATIWVLAAS